MVNSIIISLSGRFDPDICSNMKARDSRLLFPYETKFQTSLRSVMLFGFDAISALGLELPLLKTRSCFYGGRVTVWGHEACLPGHSTHFFSEPLSNHASISKTGKINVEDGKAWRLWRLLAILTVIALPVGDTLWPTIQTCLVAVDILNASWRNNRSSTKS